MNTSEPITVILFAAWAIFAVGGVFAIGRFTRPKSDLNDER